MQLLTQYNVPTSTVVNLDSNAKWTAPNAMKDHKAIAILKMEKTML